MSLVLISVSFYLLWQSLDNRGITYEFTETDDSEEPIVIDYKEPTNSYNSKNLNEIIAEEIPTLTPEAPIAQTPIDLPQVDLAESQLPEPPKYVENEIVVEIKDPNNIPEIANTKSVEKIDDTTYKYVVNSPEDLKTAITELNNSDAVKFAEHNQIYSITQIPNDVHFDKMWSLNNTGQTGGTNDADIDAPEAWDITTGSEDIIIAVIDTGVDYNHPDIANNILRDASGNVVGYDFVNNDADPMDDHGHGTHVAGTIAASSNNSAGITGICQRCKIMPIKFLDHGGSGSLEQGIQSIQFAIDHGAHIINNSWGGSGYTQALDEVITEAYNNGIVVVSGAGNNNSSYPFYPAAYQHSLSVAATDNMDQRSSYSNYGGTIDIAAPGGGLNAVTGCRTDYTNSILSLGASGNVIMWNNTPTNCKFEANGERYLAVSGTSMATPHVAGAFGLLKSHNPDWNAEQLIVHMLETTDDISAENPNYTNQLGTGRLNIHRALSEPFNNNFKGIVWMQSNQKAAVVNNDFTDISYRDIVFYDSNNRFVTYAYAGQTIYFEPSFKNFTGTIPELNTSLTSNSSCITINNPNITMTDITGWTEFTIPQPIEITIGTECDPSSVVGFNFRVYDGNDTDLITKDISLDIGHEFVTNIKNIRNSSNEIIHEFRSNSNLTLEIEIYERSRFIVPADTYKVVLSSTNPCISFPTEITVPAIAASSPNLTISNIPVVVSDCSADNIIDIKREVRNINQQIVSNTTQRFQADIIDNDWLKSNKDFLSQLSEDLNNDGTPENVFFGNSTIEILDNNLTNIPGWPFDFKTYLKNKFPSQANVNYQISYNVIGNVDGDVENEIIVIFRQTSGSPEHPYDVLLVLNHNGTVDESLTEVFTIKDREPYYLTIADLDRNSIDDILFIEEGSYTGTTNIHNTVLKIIFNPGVSKEIKSIEIPSTQTVILSPANIDSDHQMEVILSSTNPTTKLISLYKLDITLPSDLQLSQIGQYNDFNMYPFYSKLLTDDLNNDGQIEILFDVGGSAEMDNYFPYGSILSKDQITYIIDIDGNVLPGWPKPGRTPSAGDLNGDNIKEIITTEYYDELIPNIGIYRFFEDKNLYDIAGNLIWKKPFDYKSLNWNPILIAAGSDFIVDANGDGILDLMTTPSYGTYDYSIVGLDYAGNKVREFFPGRDFESYGLPIIYKTSDNKIGILSTFDSNSTRRENTFGISTNIEWADEKVDVRYETVDAQNTYSKVTPSPLIISTDLVLQGQIPTEIQKGDTLNYTMKLRAIGSDALAENVTFSASLTESITLTFVSTSKGACNPTENRIDCTIDSINSTEEVVIQLSLDTNLISDPDQVVANFIIGTTTTEISTVNNSKSSTTLFKLSNPILLAPKVNTGLFKPVYKWNEVDRASKYRFRVVQDTYPAKFFEAEYVKATVCIDGVCQINPDFALTAYNNYTWSVIAVHDNGVQSTKVSEVIKPIPPTQPTLVSPGVDSNFTTIINDNAISYKWTENSLAYKYRIQIYKGTTGVIVLDRVLESNEYSCINSECSIVILNTNPNGNYRWMMTGVNDYGNGSVSPSKSYKFEYISPSNVILNINRPEYKFGINSPAGAFVGFVINRVDSNGLNPVYAYGEGNPTPTCVNSICSLNPNFNLTNGNYTWSITFRYVVNGILQTQQINSKKFTIDTPAPTGSIVEIAPINTTIRNTVIEFSWQKDPVAIEYKVNIKTAAGLNYSQPTWYPANTICGTDNICKVTQSHLTVETNYLWAVEGRTPGGSSDATQDKAFTYKIISPSNETITTHIPTYQWLNVPNSTYSSFVIYKVNADGTKTLFNTSGTTPVSSFITCANNLCTANRNIVLPNGKYSWTVNYKLLPNTTNRILNSQPFTVSVPLPGNVVEVSPKDNLQTTDILQEFTWQADAVATEYRIFLNKVVGTTATALPTSTTWYQKSSICGADNICKVKLSVPLAEGDYAWTVQGRTIGGVGTQTAPGTTQNRFKVLPRGTFNLIEPVGFYSGSGRPSFRWEQIGTNRNYTISSTTGKPWLIPGTTSTANFPVSFTINATNSTCDAGICSFTPATPLRYLTNHQFRVTYTSSLGQVIPSITSKVFVLPNVVSPIARISPIDPFRPVANQVFKWTRDPLAVNYVLVIQRTDVTTGTIYKAFGTAICSTTTNICTASFSQTYAAANYRWFVYGLKETLASTGITANVMGTFIALNSTNGIYTFNPATVTGPANPSN